MEEKYSIRITGGKVIFERMVLSEAQKKLITRIFEEIRKGLPLVFTFQDVTGKLKESTDKINDALWYLVMEEGKIIQLDHRNYVLVEEYQKLINKLKKYKRNQSDVISIQEFRALTQLNRKTIISLFEAFDRRGVTRRLQSRRKILLEV